MSNWYELTNKELESLPTHRLYKVYQLWQKRSSLLGYRASEYFGGGDTEAEETYRASKTQRLFIKNILDERGHIERDEPKAKTGKPSKQALAREERKWKYWHWQLTEPNVEPKCLIENPESCIDKQVFKRSKKPFKSKNHYNTVKTITQNPHTGRKAFTFEEDESIVDVHICDIRKVKTK